MGVHSQRRGKHRGRNNTAKIRRRLLLESMLPPGVPHNAASVLEYYGLPSNW